MRNGDGLHAEWIAVDWGTSACRAWAIGPAGEVLAEAQSGDGMATLDRAGFEPALMRLVEGWLGEPPTPVVACGMVGAGAGWVEAGYRGVPCTPLARPVPVPDTDPRIAVHVVPGLKQDRPAGVMRGEETQIAGFLAREPAFDGVLCLPGTHTKWVQISAGEVVSFQTAMTGELFAAIGGHTILRQTLAAEGWDEAAFAASVEDAMSRPEALALRLFTLRAEALLDGLPGDSARSRLSGLLVGAELAATRPYWLGQDIALVGAAALTDAYAAALAAQGAAPRRTDATELTLAGLARARAALEEDA